MESATVLKRARHSAALCALVPCAVCRNGHISHASLALDVAVVLHAWLLAVAVRLDSGSIDSGLVGRCRLDEANGFLESLLFSCAVLLTKIEILGDEVAARLDLLEVLLDGVSVLSGGLQVLLSLQEVLLLFSEIFLQFRQSLLILSLFLLQVGHAVLILCLRIFFIGMRLHLLFLGLIL